MGFIKKKSFTEDRNQESAKIVKASEKKKRIM